MRFIALAAFAALTLAGCGSDSPYSAYQDSNDATVVQGSAPAPTCTTVTTTTGYLVYRC
jgi:PBP1b-binding outer membrane lipoprotein LpoB